MANVERMKQESADAEASKALGWLQRECMESPCPGMIRQFQEKRIIRKPLTLHEDDEVGVVFDPADLPFDETIAKRPLSGAGSLTGKPPSRAQTASGRTRLASGGSVAAHRAHSAPRTVSEAIKAKVDAKLHDALTCAFPGCVLCKAGYTLDEPPSTKVPSDNWSSRPTTAATRPPSVHRIKSAGAVGARSQSASSLRRNPTLQRASRAVSAAQPGAERLVQPVRAATAQSRAPDFLRPPDAPIAGSPISQQALEESFAVSAQLRKRLAALQERTESTSTVAQDATALSHPAAFLGSASSLAQSPKQEGTREASQRILRQLEETREASAALRSSKSPEASPIRPAVAVPRAERSGADISHEPRFAPSIVQERVEALRESSAVDRVGVEELRASGATDRSGLHSTLYPSDFEEDSTMSV